MIPDTHVLNILTVSGAAGLALFLIAGLLFFITSLREYRKRAAYRALLLLVPFSAGGMLLLTARSLTGIVIWNAVTAAAGLTALFMLLPFGTAGGLQIPGPQEPIDERDAIFHRFLRLRPGTKEFEEFYRQHPELKQKDAAIRAMPDIDQPGTESYDACTTPFSSALFTLMDRLFRDCRPPDFHAEADGPNTSPEENTRRIKGFSRFAGADLAGTARLNPAYIYTNIGRSPGKWGAPVECDHPFAVVLAVEMDHTMVRHAPHHITTTESSLKYYRAGTAALAVSAYIQKMGYKARAHVDGNYRILCEPVAVDAGLGELGRLGLLITPEYGPRVRLAVVTTDMPLVPDRPITFGVQDFCGFCKKCAVNCPPGAIEKYDKKIVAGAEKWQSSQEACYTYWHRAGSDCSICLKVCPYSHPGTLLHRIMRYAVSRNSVARRLALIMDDFFYGRRPKDTYPFPDWHKPC